METRGQYTYSEILSQPQVWGEALALLDGMRSRIEQEWAKVAPRQVIFTGCGSTHYLAVTAAALLQGLTGVPARGLPASEIVLFTPNVLFDPEHTLLVAVSRSGTTSETVAAMAKFRRLGGKAVWSITCYPETPVGEGADLILGVEMAQEESIAQTRSFSTMLVAAQAMAAVVGGADMAAMAVLPETCRHLLESTAATVERLGKRRDLERFFFLGSGPQYGMACEAMLKMKEMSVSHSEAYHFLEFRHGPKALVDEQSLVIGLLSQRAFALEEPVLSESSAMGADIVSLSPVAYENSAVLSVDLPASLPEWAMPALYLPPLQLMAYHRSYAKGLDPDRPRNLDAVVFLDADKLV